MLNVDLLYGLNPQPISSFKPCCYPCCSGALLKNTEALSAFRPHQRNRALPCSETPPAMRRQLFVAISAEDRQRVNRMLMSDQAFSFRRDIRWTSGML